MTPAAVAAIEAAARPGEPLAAIAAGADARDRGTPRFPEDAVAALEAAGLLAATVPLDGPPAAAAEEWALVRRIAWADGSVARDRRRAPERGGARGRARPGAAADGRARRGRRGRPADGGLGSRPGPGRGCTRPAGGSGRRLRVEGVKVFCSGAGGIERALVTVRGASLRPVLVLVDVTRGVEIDRSWFRGSGMRTSESHRVVFDGAPVLAVLGAPGELVREPWFSRDAIRTAACWAGIADRAADAALEALADRGPSDLDGAAAGRIVGARTAIDVWLEAAGRRAADPSADLAAISVHLRAAVADACRTIVDLGARAAGARAMAGPGDLDRCRRDLELFLLQHRLEPMVARVGRTELERRR